MRDHPHELGDPTLPLVDPARFLRLMKTRLEVPDPQVKTGYLLTPCDRRYRSEFGAMGHFTHFGGRPFVRPGSGWEWPRDSSGSPLALVAQIDLADAELDNSFKTSAPAVPPGPHGMIVQLFHDLESYGDPEDDDGSGWRVMVTPAVDEDEQVTPRRHVAPFPRDLPRSMRRRPTPLHAEYAATIPAALDVFPAGGDAIERYGRVQDMLEAYAYTQNAMLPDALMAIDDDDPVYDPASRFMGFPSVEHDDLYADHLREGLDLDDLDDAVLLAEINPLTLGEGDWLHGGRPLQVWMRADDRAAGSFDRTWCLIRTDG